MAMLARSESRDGYAVRVLAVHTTEGSGTAESLRDATWWTGSSHALADESGKLLTPAEGCVPYNLASWTLRSGNRWSENIELVGFAKWKRGDWLARPKLLDACARWLAARSVARGIPLVKLSPKEYAAGRSGVIGHVDHTIGYNDGTHWDPGPDFPYDVVLAKAAAYAGGGTPAPTPTPNDTKEIDVDAVVVLGITSQDPAVGGYWVVNLATFTRWRARNFDILKMYEQAGCKKHENQSPEMLAGFVLVGGL